jgi:large subunit ribosomal protein L24
MIKLKIKKGDLVEAIAGGEKGKRGNVIEVDPTKFRLKVQGLKVMTHFDRKEGILKKEGYIDYSNVKLVEKAKAAKPAKAAKKKAEARS